MNIFELKTQLSEFLKKHPELRPMQAKIDEMLANAGNQHNRNVLLQQMMFDKVKELEKALLGEL